MRLGVSLVLGIWVLFTFSSCSGFLSSLREESRAADEESERDRVNEELANGTYKPRTLTGLSANNVSEFDGGRPREYGRKLAGRARIEADNAGEDYDAAARRVTKEDFVDRDTRENSLWDAQGQNNYLFANNRRREAGDMLTADVEKELRREIQYQLWLTLPPEQRRVKRQPASAAASDAVSNTAAGAAKDAAPDAAKPAVDKGVEAKAKDAAEEAAKTNMASNGKEDDFIRMEVVETLGNGLVRVLGQKRVIYKGVSKVVEVSALVNNKDVDDSNHTKSSSFLDTKAQVIQ